MGRYVVLDGVTLDLLALGINCLVLGASGFLFALQGMAWANVPPEYRFKAALYAGLMGAGLRVVSYLMVRLRLTDYGNSGGPPIRPPGQA